jgi:hypothetical protein
MTVSISGTNGLVFNDGSSQNTSAFTGGFAFRNRLINSDMRIDQRNAGASVTPASGTYTYTIDRFRGYATAASKFAVQQNAGNLTGTNLPVGFTNYLGATSSSAYSVTSGDTFFLSQVVEGYNIADLAWGTANAQTVTLSFWVRSSLTGTFGGSLRITDPNPNLNYIFSYTISSANTWEYKTITIVGPTTGTWNITNGQGIQVQWNLGSGSSFSGTIGVWQAGNLIAPTGATSVVGTNGATFYITGVQLEKGSTATSFDYRPYGTELALCQRYYYLLGKGSTFAWLGNAVCADTVEAVYLTPVPVPMRATPSFLTSGSLRLYNGATRAVTSSAINVHATPNIPATTFTASGGGMAAGQGVGLTANNDTAAFISYSAEL